MILSRLLPSCLPYQNTPSIVHICLTLCLRMNSTVFQILSGKYDVDCPITSHYLDTASANIVEITLALLAAVTFYAHVVFAFR